MGAESRVRPTWLPQELYPFGDHYAEIDGARVHYVDEGSGPPLLLLHGNPTWSFLYRDIISGLRDRYRCIAPDYPGFGLSTAPSGYGFTPAEHAEVIEKLLLRLDLTNVTLMVQDWGGPIGFAVATRHPDRFAAFVIGNTWAWPKSDLDTQLFSRILGGPIGGYLIRRRNFFVERIVPSLVKRKTLPEQVMDAYRGPFPTPESRRPMQVLPRELLSSRPFLAEIATALPRVADRPALIVWADQDIAFRDTERRRWEAIFREHRTVPLHRTGHYLQEDAPVDVVAAIRDWRTANTPTIESSHEPSAPDQ
ncbi:alpha/beta fold hydrolase [Nocardia sp. NPDC051030]|uniref:alpha/beta fold hydrolase n=1 Tax=Nocardia sp. NPDC051030 TaxID=3155162 RepID=UPI0034404EC9